MDYDDFQGGAGIGVKMPGVWCLVGWVMLGLSIGKDNGSDNEGEVVREKGKWSSKKRTSRETKVISLLATR